MRTKAATLGASFTLLAACSSPAPGPPAPPADASAIVVGVQGDSVVGLVGKVHVTTSIDGITITDDTVDLLASPAALPRETKLLASEGSATAAGVHRAAVRVEGFAPGSDAPGAAPVITRTAEAAFVAGATKLLRVSLDNRCTLQAGAPTCRAGETCLGGRCQSDVVAPDQLEEYSPTWAVEAPDVCKPAGHGAPVVIVGTGQTDFLPITDGQTLQAEKGPQGGHHLWIATRVKNLRQSGSTTSITAVQPDTGAVISPTVFVFTFDTDEGGFCKLFGLRYQLDNGGIDYKQFLGKPLDVSVTVHDASGSEATGIAHVVVAPTVLGE